MLVVVEATSKGGVYMNDSGSIGSRLREIRRERGLTQEQLAARSGVSAVTVRKLEQGAKSTARIPTLAKLANALGVPLSELLEQRERFGGTDKGLLPLRDALQAPGILPGLAWPAADTEPVSADLLAEQVGRAWRDYWAGEFAVLADGLPGLLARARDAAEADSAVYGLAAQACQITANLFVHAGSDDLAWAAVRLGMKYAHEGDDPLRHAVLGCTASWVMLHQARHGEAEDVARVMAEQIRPDLSKAPAPQVVVYGGLLLSAAAAAASAGRADETGTYIAEAKGATRARWHGQPLFGPDRYDYECNFGLTQVRMQECFTAAQLRRPGAALKAAGGVRRADLRPISWGAHQLDLATAHLDASEGTRLTDGHEDAALWSLLEAHSVSPVWFRNQGSARTMVREIAARKMRTGDELRTLMRTVGMR
jgi:transcriptional regulator with XRE-family HTH domain